MRRTRYTAEVEDPVTRETTTLTAQSREELDHLVEEHLAATYSGETDQVKPVRQSPLT